MRSAYALIYCHMWKVRLYHIFLHYLIKGPTLGKTVCSIYIFYFLHDIYLKHFSLHEEFSEIWPKMYIGLNVKYPLFLSVFNRTWICSTDFRNTLEYNFMKSRPVGAELFHADGRTDGRTDRQTDRQTDVTKLMATFRNFVNAPKNQRCCNTDRRLCTSSPRIIFAVSQTVHIHLGQPLRLTHAFTNSHYKGIA